MSGFTFWDILWKIKIYLIPENKTFVPFSYNHRKFGKMHGSVI